jgi:diguanylate cyclase (GGDEF)-like protein/PAS domain S-box-containing protein
VSVSVHLAGAFGVCVAALMAVVATNAVSTTRHARTSAAQTVRAQAQIAASDFDQNWNVSPSYLSSFTSQPAITSLDAHRCGPVLQSFANFGAGLTVDLIDTSGAVICTSGPAAGLGTPIDLDPALVRRVFAGTQPVVTALAPASAKDPYRVLMVVPIRGDDGRAAALVSRLPVNSYPITNPHSGTDLVIVNAQERRVVAAAGNAARYAGRTLDGSDLARIVANAGGTGRGLDGVRRVYGAAQSKTFGWTVLNGVPVATMQAAVNDDIRREILLGLLSILLVVQLGVLLRRRIATPLRSLTAAIVRSGSTDGGEDAAPVEGPAEMARVAEAFNTMLEARRHSEERFRALVQHASDLILVIDEHGGVAYASPAVERVLGDPDALGFGSSLLDAVHPSDRSRLRSSILAWSQRPGVADPIEVRVAHASGEWRQVEAIANNLLADPAVAGIVVTTRDVTERKAFEEHLAHQALHDPLTGLPNRALVLDRLNHGLARANRTGTQVGVLFLDLDRFKLVNDSHGHAAGDEMLVALAQRLSSTVRPADTVARFGGDEFVVLCEDIGDESEALEIAERLADALRVPFVLGSQEMYLSGSIGIAMSTAGDRAEDLLRNADAAMYRAKERGRARCELFDSAMRERAMSRLELESDLHRAVERNEFLLHFQPKINLRAGRVVGVEALVRWEHPTRGLVAPNEFIAVAEETGLIVPIGRYVIEEACWHIARWRRLAGDRGPMVSVNLSARQLQHPDIVDVVATALTKSGVDPGDLCVEITESVLLEDGEGAGAVLRALKDLGVQVAIDDFGTGYSALSYLQRFPIDELKVDRSFVDALCTDGAGSTIVGAVIGLAHAMDITVVAEGVETAAQLSELRRLGCDQGQGYWFARPHPSAVIDELLVSDAHWDALV